MALTAAIAGTGFIGRVHARSLRLAGIELVGVAASSPTSAAAAAAELGAARAYDSAEELVRDPEVDVVHVCTPNHLRLLLQDLADLDFISMRETSFHDTVKHEFFINLSPTGEGTGLKHVVDGEIDLG